MKPPKPTEYVHGDQHPATKRIFLGYNYQINKYGDARWIESWSSQTTKLDYQLYLMNIEANKRARAENLAFDIDMDYLRSIMVSHCPIFNEPLSWGVLGEGTNPYSPSIDKVKPEWGYIRGNVYIISRRANTIKNDADSVILTKVLEWVIKVEKEIEQNVRPEQLASLPKSARNTRRKKYPSGAILTAGTGQDSNDPHHDRVVFSGKNIDYRAQESSGDSVENRDPEVEAPIQTSLFVDLGERKTED